MSDPTCAIVGIGATEFSKCSGRSELQLAAEAVTAALNDAGLSRDDVDGFCTFTMDNNGETEVARAIGANDLRFFSRLNYGGGGGCAAVHQAMMAIRTGAAEVVVCYRAMNERSQFRLGQPMPYGGSQGVADADTAMFAYHGLSGALTAAGMMAPVIRRYMHETGARREDFAQVAIAARAYAATNPAAFFHGKPITLDDYMNARPVADPLHLLDCCQESDGAVALVITRLDRAADLRQRPAVIRAAAQGSPRGMLQLVNYYDGSITAGRETRLVGEQLYRAAGLTPADMQAAILYDHFVPTVFLSLEALGFCAPGEARDFVRDGRIAAGGALPVNMHGGQVGEAYIHGMNGIAEAVRQVRGTAVNQVPDLSNILVTSGSGVPTSGLILGAG